MCVGWRKGREDEGMAFSGFVWEFVLKVKTGCLGKGGAKRNPLWIDLVLFFCS